MWGGGSGVLALSISPDAVWLSIRFFLILVPFADFRLNISS